jgi:peroxiredoxin Q/BCP
VVTTGLAREHLRSGCHAASSQGRSRQQVPLQREEAPCSRQLYFYPKDNTPGCTTEACELRDRQPELHRRGAVVLGVSPDSIESHQKFKGKYSLPFALLSDPDHSVAEVYGAWGEKKMYGKTYEGILRTTFIIDEDGNIEQVFEKVKPKGHGDQIVKAMQK